MEFFKTGSEPRQEQVTPAEELIIPAPGVATPPSLVAAYVALSLCSLGVLTIGDTPFVLDAPNHAARLYIQCNLSDPILSQMWAIDYGIIPNLAIDLINKPLCGMIDPLHVVRGATVLSVAGILLTLWHIQKLLFGRCNEIILLAPALTFNVIVYMGYVNYLIGTFLFLVFVWLVLRWKMFPRVGTASVVVANAFGVLLFLCHIFALGLAMVFVFAVHFTAADRITVFKRVARASLVTAAAFTAAIVLILLADRSGLGFTYSPSGKIRALWAPLLYSSVQVAAALVFLWFAFFLWVIRERLFTVHPTMRVPLVMLALYALAMPSALLDAVDLDSRSIIPVAYLALASLKLQPAAEHNRRNYAKPVAALLAILTVLAQSMTAIPKIYAFERDVAEFRNGLGSIPIGSKILSVYEADASPEVPRILYMHLASYATRDRHAFNPHEFSGKGMQPLHATPGFRCLDVPVGFPLTAGVAEDLLNPAIEPALSFDENRDLRFAFRWNEKFDYVILYHFGVPSTFGKAAVRPIHQGTFFRILAIKKDAENRPSQIPCPAATSSNDLPVRRS